MHVLKPYCVLHSVVDIVLEMAAKKKKMAAKLNLSKLKGQKVMIPAKL